MDPILAVRFLLLKEIFCPQYKNWESGLNTRIDYDWSMNKTLVKPNLRI